MRVFQDPLISCSHLKKGFDCDCQLSRFAYPLLLLRFGRNVVRVHHRKTAALVIHHQAIDQRGVVAILRLRARPSRARSPSSSLVAHTHVGSLRLQRPGRRHATQLYAASFIGILGVNASPVLSPGLARRLLWTTGDFFKALQATGFGSIPTARVRNASATVTSATGGIVWLMLRGMVLRSHGKR